jgi:hypothetical protein
MKHYTALVNINNIYTDTISGKTAGSIEKDINRKLTLRGDMFNFHVLELAWKDSQTKLDVAIQGGF